MPTEELIVWLRQHAKGAEPTWRFVMRLAANRLEALTEKLKEMEDLDGQAGKGCR